jgi:Amidohydrolase family
MEVIAAATITGTQLHVVHIQSSGGPETDRLLSVIREARTCNIDVTTEMYPYTASATRIESALYDGWKEYTDSMFRDLLWPATGERLTRETFAKYRETGGTVIRFGNTEEVVEAAAADPLTMIASDGTTLKDGTGHPRTTGTYVRILGHYVRERKALTLMTALRKMTLMPAQRLERRVPAMKNKGRIRVGADADLTVFDDQSVIDRATYEQPLMYFCGYQVRAGPRHAGCT